MSTSILFFRSFGLLYERRQTVLPAIKIRMTINILSGCGLGSSATAVVGGLMAANGLLGMQDPTWALTKEEQLAPAFQEVTLR